MFMLSLYYTHIMSLSFVDIMPLTTLRSILIQLRFFVHLHPHYYLVIQLYIIHIKPVLTFIIYQCTFSGTDLQKLAIATRRRQRHAFRPSTIKNHMCQIKLYLAFCSHYGLRDIDPEVTTMCMYCEFLTRTFHSPKTIHNYVSGVPLLHKYAHVHSPSLDSFELQLILRSLNITMRHIPNQRLPVSINMLNQLCTLSTWLGPLGIVLKCAILLSFFGFKTIKPGSSIQQRV